jgi:V8-like Glu-specific endopeptidase
MKIKTGYILILIIIIVPVTEIAAQKAEIYNVDHVAYDVSSGTHSNGSDLRAVVFRHRIHFDGVSWIRLSLTETALSPGDYIRIVSLEDGAEQRISTGDRQYGSPEILSVLFNGGDLEVALDLAPGSRASGFTISTVMTARGPRPYRSQCGPSDDRTPVSDPCVVRVVDSFGLWGTGFMISKNCMLTANHVMTDGPWIIERNVPPSNPSDGDINHPGPADQFVLADLSSAITSGTTAYGNDWAVVYVQDNSFGSPGSDCEPAFNWTYTNDLDAEPLFVQGFGKEDSQFDRNGVLQSSGGVSVAGGYTDTHFRYQVDTEGGNSGSRVVDHAGRIAGIHAHGGCTSDDPPQGSNGGTLINNPDLVDAISALAVDLILFKAAHFGERVLVRWETASEVNHAGFHIWRCASEDGLYARMTDTLIPAQGGPGWGAAYQYRDLAVKPGKIYYYRLEDVNTQGLSFFHGPVVTTETGPPEKDALSRSKAD